MWEEGAECLGEMMQVVMGTWLICMCEGQALCGDGAIMGSLPTKVEARSQAERSHYRLKPRSQTLILRYYHDRGANKSSDDNLTSDDTSNYFKVIISICARQLIAVRVE